MLRFALLLLTVHSAISMSEMEALLIKRVETLEIELADSKLAIQKLENRANNVIAFSVVTDQGLIVANGDKITFNQIKTNVGSGWNVGQSEFVCPINGYYAFSITTLSTSSRVSNAQVIVGSEGSAKAYSASQNANGAVTHVALCNAGQVVQMRCVDPNGCAIRSGLHTGFSGFLIAAA